jgi:glycosyltransferase involved in cell wall biosynthesis
LLSSNNILLTIAIPTYNRDSLLDRQLYSLSKQSSKIDSIEILVCDNNSDDDTQNIVSKHQNKNNNIKYFKQTVNEGLDKNVLSCYENAIGSFVWFLSDDDIIFDDAIERILNDIKTIDFTIMAYSFCNNKDNCNQSTIKNIHTSFDNPQAIKDFFKVIMISTLVVKNIDINIKTLKLLPSTIFPQITLALNILHNNFVLVANETKILWREPGYTSGNFFELYCLKPRQAIRYSLFLPEDKKKLLKFTESSLRDFVKLAILEKIGFYKSKRGFPFSNLVNSFKEFKNSPYNLILVILIFIISKLPKLLILSLTLLSISIKKLSILEAIKYKKNLNKHIDVHILKAKSSDV